MRAPFRGQSVAWIVNKSGTKSVEIATFTSLIILIPSRERVQLSPTFTYRALNSHSNLSKNSNHGTVELLESDSRSLPLFSQHWHYPPKCFSLSLHFLILPISRCWVLHSVPLFNLDNSNISNLLILQASNSNRPTVMFKRRLALSSPRDPKKTTKQVLATNKTRANLCPSKRL